MKFDGGSRLGPVEGLRFLIPVRQPAHDGALETAHTVKAAAANGLPGNQREPGKPNTAVARKLGLTYQTVGKWRQRFLERRLDGLLDEPRPGAPRQVGDAQVEQVVRLTLESTPADATHWSTRAMAKRSGLTQTMAGRIWRAFGLQPHRVEGFKLSKDPLFIEKVRDIVGSYLNPPDRALVLCVDEKAQIQALDRSQPLLPMRPGQAERRTPDYLRHGTINLFAALDAKAGTVIGEFHQRHRAVEFRNFLATIEAAVPGDLELHLILDNYGTHKTPAIKRWLLRHPRFHLHFTPTGGSWLNLVERWVCAAHRKATAPRRSPQHPRTGGRDPYLPRTPQPPSQTLHLDQNCRPNSRRGRPIL